MAIEFIGLSVQLDERRIFGVTLANTRNSYPANFHETTIMQRNQFITIVILLFLRIRKSNPAPIIDLSTAANALSSGFSDIKGKI